MASPKREKKRAYLPTFLTQYPILCTLISHFRVYSHTPRQNVQILFIGVLKKIKHSLNIVVP